MAALLAAIVGWLSKEFVPKCKYDVPLPPECHLVLTEEKVSNRPIFVIGDVHGCYDELRHLLFKARNIHSNALFLFVGDLVNKGPKSAETLGMIRSLNANGDGYSVRGNHDEVVLRESLRRKANSEYEPQAKYKWTEAISEEDLSFLESLPYTISIPSHKALVVHAGLVPGIPLCFQNLADLVSMRNLVQEDYFEGRGLVAMSGLEEGCAWGQFWPGPMHVYFGHDARRGLQEHGFATGLDTGCVYGGELTGVFLCPQENNKFLSVKSFHKYKKADLKKGHQTSEQACKSL